MRQRIKTEILVTTSATSTKSLKRRHSTKPAVVPAKFTATNKISRSKKALKKLVTNRIGYKPFSLLKETTGNEGNYWKLIYNTPKY
jgi:hypothetical protein